MQNGMIEQQLSQLGLGDAQWIHNLSVYPLLADEDSLPGYLTLDQAINNKQARITEVSEGGHDPTNRANARGRTSPLARSSYRRRLH